MKNNYYLVFLFSFMLVNCTENTGNSSSESIPIIDEKEFLDHIILNDSIEYRIKEYNEKNNIKRKICVFKKGRVIKEHPIYFLRKKEILDEGYNSTQRTLYTNLDFDLFEIKEYTYHYYDYNLENVDTSTYSLKVTAIGEIEIKKIGLVN